ncbi:putative N-acetyltransferase YhbS [Paenibacillus cellulosilyticus]|uniref:Putative N-acetyltransferase YhbS n=1 Tax=Paenibacillus cellulosilyticus TaxID=375489 RepID=A0A2V2YTW1_9BACL|nr:GNAT family N-acetyltransferase [Paenibacillus cellulosilyticus]PWV99777.1 putative N-acetyltransferase YhbS [Paenibacillus cellulosilyticus]QKS44803.1 GNAT family N-acetyltransferase [Paenibacillus cellulosilyticus]
MDNLLIEAYNPERDRAAAHEMLREDKHFRDIFEQNERNYPEGLHVARYGGVMAGFLSLSGLKRGTGTTVYVSPPYRRTGIGTRLMEKAHQLLASSEAVERSSGLCIDGDSDTLQFLYKHGYYVVHSSYLMEREGEPLPGSSFTIRQYEDEDYLTCHYVSEFAFYLMRECVGIMPTFYYEPEEWERISFAEDRNNRFVMLSDGEIVAVGVIDGPDIRHVAVRPDRQARGYGGAMVSFLVNEIMRRGESTVELWVVKGNPAQKLYERLGFKTRSLHHIVQRYYRPESRLSRPPELWLHELKKI